MKKLLLLLLIVPVLGFGQGSDIILNGIIYVQKNPIKDLADPTDGKDAVTKDYLLDKIASLQEQIDFLKQRLSYGTAFDQDGNTFDWIKYGTQDWAIENAEVVTYRDGTPIPQVTDPIVWSSLTIGAWCYYENDPSKGKLYNWYAVAGIHDNDPNTPNKVFAPEGWNVPTKTQFTKLENHLIDNGYNYDGTNTDNKIAKSVASISGWETSSELGVVGNDQSSNNRSGFNIIPVGLGNPLDEGANNLIFYGEGTKSVLWSLTVSENVQGQAYGFIIFNFSKNTSLAEDSMNFGASVRFVREFSTEPTNKYQKQSITNTANGFYSRL